LVNEQWREVLTLCQLAQRHHWDHELRSAILDDIIAAIDKVNLAMVDAASSTKLVSRVEPGEEEW
jgi:hypothetical protein